MKILLTSLLLCCALVQAQNLKSGVFDPPRMAPEIGLPGSHGKLFKLGDYRSKVVVLEFGFSQCKTVCPGLLASLAAARRQLGAAGRDVQVAFISVDPQRDTPVRMRTYLTQFDPSFI